MFRASVQRVCAVLGAAVIAALLSVGTASADGSCGHDFDGPTACPIATSGAVAGSLGATFEKDYFVFYAQRRTHLTLTLTDTEDPTCGIYGEPNLHVCSAVFVQLYNHKGHYIAQSRFSQPQNGVPVSVVLSRSLPAAGVYYAAVTGELNSVGPIPYSLQVNGSPNVQWPPPCTVPRLRRDTSLGRAIGLLRFHHCSAGRVVRVRDARVPRGDVLGLIPRAGTVAAAGAPVVIVVSRGRRHHGQSRPRPAHKRKR